MTKIGFLQWFLYLIVVLLSVKPLGHYMALVYERNPSGLDFLGPIEARIYKLCSIYPEEGMDWKQYLFSMLVFNFFGMILLYIILRLQAVLPFNPEQVDSLSPHLAFNAAISFVSNTNWQAFNSETSISYFSQMLGFTVQNFLSAATGMSLLIAFIRGLVGRGGQGVKDLGNFWVDLVRGILYILLPLSLILAIVLISEGVLQNVKASQSIQLFQPFVEGKGLKASEGEFEILPGKESKKISQESKALEEKTEIASGKITEQKIAMGPVASQVAIKLLGSNGGGFFNTNSAHPFENPSPLTNFLSMWAILLIPAAFCYTFGILVKDKRQGLALLSAMLLIFVPLQFCSMAFEQSAQPVFQSLSPQTLTLSSQGLASSSQGLALSSQSLGLSSQALDSPNSSSNNRSLLPSVDQTFQPGLSPGGNMEGKETRFGIVSSALFVNAATATSNGSVNAMLDSFTPLGGMVSLCLMHLGEVVFGGVGSGLYGMLLFVILTVFISGLMVGRTPEYLGKKIEAFEMKMASFAILVMPMIVLIATSIVAMTKMSLTATSNPSVHGFSEILYGFTSMANNNGSAFAGLKTDSSVYAVLSGIVMFIGRYWLAIPMLAIAGSLVEKQYVPVSTGTLQTHSLLFIVLIVTVILLLGALSFFPVLVLGPFIEHLQLWSL